MGLGDQKTKQKIDTHRIGKLSWHTISLPRSSRRPTTPLAFIVYSCMWLACIVHGIYKTLGLETDLVRIGFFRFLGFIDFFRIIDILGLVCLKNLRFKKISIILHVKGEICEKMSVMCVELIWQPVQLTSFLMICRGISLSKVDEKHYLCVLPTSDATNDLLQEQFPNFSVRSIDQASKKTKQVAQAKSEGMYAITCWYWKMTFNGEQPYMRGGYLCEIVSLF